MGKLTSKGLAALMKKPPKRWPDGDGLFFRTAGQGKAYWTARYTVGRRERETSLGPYPEVGIDEARIKHLDLRAALARKVDPVGKRSAKTPSATPSGTPTFGQWPTSYIATHEGGWKNAKHHQQWVMTLREYAAPIRDLPVDQIDAKAVLAGAGAEMARRPRNHVAAQRPHRGDSGVGSGRRLDRSRQAESGAVEELARPHAASAEEDRLARPPRGDGLSRSARLHGQARPDGRRRRRGRSPSPS